MQQQIPSVIAPLLDGYLTTVEQQLPGLVVGFYLHGSIALGTFNERSSDIDALAVVSRRCTPSDIDALKAIHQKMQKDTPRPFLEVSYLQASDLGQLEDQVEAHPYSHDGKLYPSGHFEINSVTWWILKNRGITLKGTPAADLNFAVDWDRLIANMRINLNSYWLSYTRNPQRIAWLLSDYGVQWAVTGVLRQYYSFREGGITSKDGAGRYALDHVPEKWHRLIQEALNIRSGTHQVLYGSSVVRALDAFRFLNYIIRESNNLSGAVD
ncbi:MAG: aminoglycoside adenylyltransferase domain-containing protein [Chloroflexota bacterium]